MGDEKERKEASRCFRDVVLPQAAESVMEGAQNERMGPGEDRQRYDSKIEHSAAEAAVFRSHHPSYQSGEGHHPRTDRRTTRKRKATNKLDG